MRDPEAFPRFPLGLQPSPLELAPRLSRQLGIRLLLKREDLTGFGLGGNKVPKMEYLIADAVAQDADAIIVSGALQSNFLRVASAAARKAGLEAHAIVSGPPPAEMQGNLLLDHLLGARIVYAGSREQVEPVRQRTYQDLRRRGKRPYLIPPGGSCAVGCLAYVVRARDIAAEAAALDARPDYLFCATGSCGTHAGLLLGAWLFDAPFQVCGVSVSRSAQSCRETILRLVEETARLLETAVPLTPEDVVAYDQYIGPGYGLSTPACLDAIRTVAQAEAILLDPVYTGKVMAGLKDLVGRGVVARGATVVFLHSGGLPALFAYAGDLQ